MKNWLQGIRITDQSSLALFSSTFHNVGSLDVKYGEAIQTVNSNITIKDSLFDQCQARQDGWLVLLCSKDMLCSYNIRNTQFSNSHTDVKGGALYYNLNRPKLDNIVYNNNTADYGNDIASYPIKVKLLNTDSDLIKLEKVVSDQVCSPSLEFQLVDHDEQAILTDSSSTIKVNTIDNNTSLNGTLVVVVDHGVAVFDQLIFIAKPGSQNVMFDVISNAIDNDIIYLQYIGTVEQKIIDASFQYCESGKIESNNKFQVWSPGSYSLGANKTQCINCMPNAVWLGGKQINVNDGYFRSSHNSDSIIKWIRSDSCKGGFIENAKYPTKFEKRYNGLLWSECIINDKENYERDSSFACRKWPDVVLNTIRIVDVMMPVLIYLTYLIAINLKKSLESQTTTLMRILTNYLQVVSTVIVFNANYSQSLTNLFSPAEMIRVSSRPLCL